MKLFVTIILLSAVIWSAQSNYCTVGGTVDGRDIGSFEWQDMNAACSDSVKRQIHRELNASLTYLAMGAHFTTELHYRPGVATFFIASASEERSHAKDLMEYLLLRGLSIEQDAIPPIAPPRTWVSIAAALKSALDIELSVRKNFVDIIEVCEGKTTGHNDYHAADLMTGKFLEEQHQSIRELSGHLATLVKMKDQYGEFAEVMFDKTMQK